MSVVDTDLVEVCTDEEVVVSAVEPTVDELVVVELTASRCK